jgi:GT2 family glycosyltransferase
MSFPKVFIIILNWNGLKDTLECLESVFKLDYPNFEVIVVDNGSTDNSAEIIQKIYPKVILIKNKENLGYTGGNNIGMRYAMDHSTDYMWLLNNDTIVELDTLTKLVNTAESCPEIGLVSPVIYYYDEPDNVQFYGSYIDWKDHTTGNVSQELWLNENIKRALWLWGTALLIKCLAIERVGYLNEKYFAYIEDLEYSVRMSMAGYKIVLEPRAKVYHKDSRSTGNRNAPLQVFLRTRNIYFLWMKYLKGFNRLEYFRKYWAYAISYGASLREKNLNESADACLAGAWSAICGIGGHWNKNIKMPSILKKIFSWHPYFWTSLLKGDFSNIFSEVFKRIKLRFINLYTNR